MAGTRKRLIATIPAAAALGLALAGCSFSTTKTLDMQKAQDEIAKGIQEQTGETVTVKCPDSVEIKAGNTFTCEVLAQSGESGTVTVTENDDQGNITWKLEPTITTPTAPATP